MVDLSTMSRPSSSQSFHPQHHPHHQRQEGSNGTQHQTRTGGYCLRSNLRRRLFKTGRVIQKHAGVVLFVGVLLLLTLSVSLKSATIETDIESLWVEEDGRVEKELNYIRKTLGEGIGSTNQLLIQTPRDPQANILHPESLLHHLEVMKAATEVTVDLFEVTWRLKDVCLTPSIPSFEEVHVEKIFDHLFPCAIMSPLDCFWEGSKLLGPDYPVRVPGLPHLNVKWTNLHPESLFSMLKGMESLSSFPFESFHEIMKRAGITSAYQGKPCLNPEDPDCPTTAPNKGNRIVPDVGSELTGGCYGFATKYMHWPEDLIVGGAKKNRTGHIVRANAVQTVIQLMGEQQMHEFWAKDYKVHNVDWTIEKARMVLEAWQRKFSAEVSKLVGIDGRRPPIIPRSRQYSYTLFTTTLLSDIMRNFSQVNHMKIGIGFLVILLFVALTSWSREDSSSFVFVSTAGVCLIGLSIVSSLGLCSLFRLPLNAATTQITPFLALGFGVCLLQLLIYSYAAVYQRRSHLYFDDLVGEVLQKVGPVIGVISLCGVTGFLSAFFIPIPALRAFVLQFAIILALLTGALLIIFPAILSLDLRRRRAHRVDLFCCLHRSVTDEEMNEVTTPSTNHRQASSSNHHRYSSSPRQPRRHLPNNLLSSSVRYTHNDLNSLKSTNSGECPVHSSKTGEAFHPFKKLECTCFTVRVPITDSEADTDTDNEETSIQQTRRLSTSRNGHHHQIAVVGEKGEEDESRTSSFLLSSLVKCHSQLLKKKAFKYLVLMVNTVILLISLSGLPNVRDGLELTDIVPRGTVEHKYLEVQHKFFSFYNMFVVTEGDFEYPTNQKLLYEYHQSFNRISKIIKNDDGGLPEFWLSTFRDWLRNLQDAYDRDSSMGFISQEGWKENASSDAILAYKLLVQTGRNDYPVDKSLVTKVRLVDKEGIINPKAFYTYLTAWASNDALAYYASQANLKPEPREWFHDPSDTELKIPKSQPLTYTQIPFYLNRMNSTDEIVTTIGEVRAICQKFEEERGLPNFPSGVPFVFWEQYVRLPFYALTSGLIALAIVFGLVGIFLFNIWASSLVVFFLILIAVQLYGLMGFFGINFSAVPAVILVISVGLGTVFFLPVVFTFLACQGGRRYRTVKSVKETGVPVLHGSLGLLVGVFMLYWSEFDFIINYFFLVLVGFIILGMFYGFLLLPILLSMMGPPPESSISIEESLLYTPSEESGSPKTSRKEGARRIKTLPNQYFSRRDPKVQSDISLSTIPEESHPPTPNSAHHPYYQSSREIVVQPEFVVETTTFTSPVPMSCKVGDGGDEGTSSIPPQTSFTPNCESPLSREVTASPASDIGSSSGASSMSRPNSAPAECVHSSSRSHSASIPSTTAHCSHHQIPQTVTTKVTTTAKLKVELHAPPHYVRTTGGDGNSNSSSSSSSSNVANSKDPFHKGYRDKYYFLNKDNHRSSNNNSR